MSKTRNCSFNLIFVVVSLILSDAVDDDDDSWG